MFWHLWTPQNVSERREASEEERKSIRRKLTAVHLDSAVPSRFDITRSRKVTTISLRVGLRPVRIVGHASSIGEEVRSHIPPGAAKIG